MTQNKKIFPLYPFPRLWTEINTHSTYTYEPNESRMNPEYYYLPDGYTIDTIFDGSRTVRNEKGEACEIGTHFGNPVLISSEGFKGLKRISTEED